MSANNTSVHVHPQQQFNSRPQLQQIRSTRDIHTSFDTVENVPSERARTGGAVFNSLHLKIAIPMVALMIVVGTVAAATVLFHSNATNTSITTPQTDESNTGTTTSTSITNPQTNTSTTKTATNTSITSTQTNTREIEPVTNATITTSQTKSGTTGTATKTNIATIQTDTGATEAVINKIITTSQTGTGTTEAVINTNIATSQTNTDATRTVTNTNITSSQTNINITTDQINTGIIETATNTTIATSQTKTGTTGIATSTSVTSIPTSIARMTTSTRSSSTTMVTTTFPAIYTYIYWSFDSNYNDFYNVYNGIGVNNPTFVSPGYNGYGSALRLSSTSFQYVSISTYKNMTYTSFTWEMWVYPMNLNNSNNPILSMCQLETTDRCLSLSIGPNVPYFSFYDDDCWNSSSATVEINQWHHFGFVYDYLFTTQYIYWNGLLICTHSSAGPFLGSSGTLTIGAISKSRILPTYFWTGLIDQVSYVSRAKAANEILTDATLVAYYSFDNGSFYDSGPNKINGTGVNVTSVNGRINQAILFNGNGQYFQVTGLTLLGAVYRSYSIALWIYQTPPVLGYGTILYMLQRNIDSGWCLPILGFTSTNQIVGQNWDFNYGPTPIIGSRLATGVWAHIVTSYSVTNGVCLWINGTLINSTGAFTYGPSNFPNKITLGDTSANSSGCSRGPIVPGQFYGMMDELRIYSRELNATDIYALANP